MATAQQQLEKAKKPLELVRPEQRGLMQVAAEIGALVNRGGLAVIDLSSPEILENYNVLAPTKVMVQANPNFTPSISIVKFDPKRGSVYPIDKKWDPKAQEETWINVAFGKLELLQIAKAMGLRVLKPDIRTGEGASKRDIIITAVVLERDVDGTWIPYPGSQTWVHDDEYERTVAECPDKKWTGSGKERMQISLTEEDKRAWIAKNWLQRKKFSLRVTETKALEAAIRAAGEIPTKFPVEDLDRPFIVVRYTFTPDPSDVRIVLAQIEAGQNAAAALYPHDPDARAVREILEEDDGAGLQTDPATGLAYDPETGVVEGTCTEEPVSSGGDDSSAENQTHGAMPDEDREVPRGKYATRKLSEVCKEDPAYAREHFLGASPPLGPLTEEWLDYYHPRDDFKDVTF